MLICLLALAAQVPVEERPVLVDNLGHANGVTALAISHTQPLLASGGMDRAVRIWDLTSTRVVRVLPNFDMFLHQVAFTKGRRGSWPSIRETTSMCSICAAVPR